MRPKTLLSCCMLGIALLLPSSAQTCGHISTWTDADASYFISLESPAVKVLQNTPKNSYQFGVPVTELTVYGNLNSWQIPVTITSFETVAQAANALEKIRAGIYAEDVISAGEPFAYVRGYYMPPPAGDGMVGDFHLVMVYQENLIQVEGGGSSKRSPADCLDSYTLVANNAIELIRSKCGENQDPFIALLPIPAQGLAFQVSLLEGKGFQILVQDPDGLSDINWSTFKIFVAGNDTTAHFLAVLQNSSGPTLLEETSHNGILFTIAPDPHKLMDAHDLFAIPFNGDYRIDLEICDSRGACARSENTVYFGPFITIAGDVRDLVCSDAWFSSVWRLVADRLIVGNTGLDSRENAVYVVLHSKADPLDYWSATFEDSPWGIHPYVKNFTIPAGYMSSSKLSIPIAPEYELHGAYEYLIGVMDTEYGTIKVDVEDVQLCLPST
jgi:hypothetical protein